MRYRSARRFLILWVSLLIIAACSDVEERSFQGYVEGDYLYLAAPSAGYLNSLNVDRGSYAMAGTIVFSLDNEPEQFELSEAEAGVVSAKEKVTNLEQPRRKPEIAEREAELRSKEANLEFSEAQLKRFEALVRKGFISEAGLDEARSARDQAAAQVEVARKQLTVYRINLGRQSEIRGAEADLEAAGAKILQKSWQVAKKSVATPANGQVIETYFLPGEWVPAGQPVLSFLPDERRRIRFFVPETQLARIRLGQLVEADCDGCRSPVRAKVAFIAAQAEYTPPVIYSRETRAKLVFRVEAIPPPSETRRLHPGLPMDVRLLDGA
jgi:HlyD family secretion protein